MNVSRELADALSGFLGVYIPEKRRRQEDAKDEKRWNMMYELQRQNAMIAREQADMNRELHQAKMDDIKRTLDIRKRMGDYLESKDLPRDPEVIGLMTDVYKMQGEAEALRQAPLLFELKQRETDASIAASRASAAAAGASAAATRQRMQMTEEEFKQAQEERNAMKEWLAQKYPEIPFGAIDTANKYLNYESGKDELEWVRSLRPDQRTQMYLDTKAREQAIEQERERHEADMRRMSRDESDWADAMESAKKYGNTPVGIGIAKDAESLRDMQLRNRMNATTAPFELLNTIKDYNDRNSRWNNKKLLQDLRQFDAGSVYQAQGDMENAYKYYETERTIKELDDQLSTLGRMIEANFGGTPQQVQDYNTLLSRRQSAAALRNGLNENALKLINPNATNVGPKVDDTLGKGDNASGGQGNPSSGGAAGNPSSGGGNSLGSSLTDWFKYSPILSNPMNPWNLITNLNR